MIEKNYVAHKSKCQLLYHIWVQAGKFDKQKMEERQELAKVFGEEAYRLAHNMKDDGSGRKIAVHAVIGGIMSKITGVGFASGAAGAGLNEALIKNLKGLDLGTAQIVSAIVGAAAAKAVGGNAKAGASAAASETKWNLLSKTDYDEMNRRLQEAKTDAERQAIKEEYQEKNKAQEENEQAEREALIREGKSSNEIADFFNNKRYPNYVTFNGDAYHRLGETTIHPHPTRHFLDFTSGIASSIDENMSFGAMRELYRGTTGHYPYSSNTNAYHLGRLTGDIASMYLGLQEIAFGMGTRGGGIAAGATGAGAVTTPALTAAGAAAVAHGGISALQAWGNTKKNLNSVLFSKSNMERGIGGKGWRGDRIWKENVKLVENGGTIERVNGEIISQRDAEILIKESKGTILRVEDGHMKGNNPHKFPHINYITRDGKKER